MCYNNFLKDVPVARPRSLLTAAHSHHVSWDKNVEVFIIPARESQESPDDSEQLLKKAECSVTLEDTTCSRLSVVPKSAMSGRSNRRHSHRVSWDRNIEVFTIPAREGA